MREIHASKHTTYTLYNKIVDKDTYIKFDFGFSDAWLPMKLMMLQKITNILPVGGKRGSQASVEYQSGSTPQQDQATLQDEKQSSNSRSSLLKENWMTLTIPCYAKYQLNCTLYDPC